MAQAQASGKKLAPMAREDSEALEQIRIDTLSKDPATGKCRPEEGQAGLRLEKKLGTELERSKHEGTDFIDPKTGVGYDLIQPNGLFFKIDQVAASLRRHLLKAGANDRVVIDLRNMTTDQRVQLLNEMKTIEGARSRCKLIW